MLIILILALLLSFYLIGKVADDYFVGSLDKIAKRFNMSSDMAGATLMAVGSSAPELFISIIALVKPGEHSEVGMGTIVGSALFNVLVIIGAASMLKRAVLPWQPIVRDLLFYTLSIMALIWAFYDGVISMDNAIVLVGLYLVYLFIVFNWRKWFPYKEEEFVEEHEEFDPEEYKGWKRVLKPIDWAIEKIFPSPEHYYWVFGISVTIIAALSWVLVESAVEISVILNIPAAIVALTVLAAGTSIPDLMSSIIVARQGRGAMAISNAFGSNIFDILVGLGVPWLITLIVAVGSDIHVSTENMYSSVMLLFATVLITLLLLLFRKWRIGRGMGIFLISLYVAYLVWAISQI